MSHVCHCQFMGRKYLAFDIETAKVTPEDGSNLLEHRPLGICCAATVCEGDPKPRYWHGFGSDGGPCEKMSVQEAAELVKWLAEKVAAGFTILTWNGLGFDFDVLAEESGMIEACRELALNHVDPMFHFHCLKGFPVGLDAVAHGMGTRRKSKVMSGGEAPKAWAEGRHQEVLEYCGLDVLALIELATAIDRLHGVRWVTKRGTPAAQEFPLGCVTVREAMMMPLPDTGWMNDGGIPRERFTAWLGEVGNA